MRGQSTAARTLRGDRREPRVEALAAWPRRDARADEQRVAVAGVLEQPVDVARAHVAGAPAERAVRPASASASRVAPGDRRAVVDLVAVELRARLAVGDAARGAWSCRPAARSRGRAARGPAPRRRPRRRADRARVRPSICSPPQMPSTGTPAAARLAIAPARPVERSQSRSASVLLVPGMTIAAAASSSAGRAHVARVRAERRELVEVRDARQRDDRDRRRRRRRPAARRRPPRAAARRATGSTPSVGTPVAPRATAGPGASSEASPRKRLSRKPASSVALVLRAGSARCRAGARTRRRGRCRSTAARAPRPRARPPC